MRGRSWVRRIALGCALFALAGIAGAARAATSPAAEQVEFGVEMARRGLWNEALFRFEAARSLGGESATVLNNLAVAYEAVGRFDDALEAYRAALRVDPMHRRLRQNYQRFVEFYQGFRPRPPAGDEPASQPAPVAPAEPASESPAGEAPEGEA